MGLIRKRRRTSLGKRSWVRKTKKNEQEEIGEKGVKCVYSMDPNALFKSKDK